MLSWVRRLGRLARFGTMLLQKLAQFRRLALVGLSAQGGHVAFGCFWSLPFYATAGDLKKWWLFDFSATILFSVGRN